MLLSLVILGLALDIIGVIFILWPALERSIMIIRKRKFVDFFWWEISKDKPSESKKMLHLFLIGFCFLIVGFVLQILGNLYNI